MTDLANLRQRLVAPVSHAGGDCQCACFTEGFDTGVDAALASFERLAGLVSLSLDGRMHAADGMCKGAGCAEVSVFIVLATPRPSDEARQL